MRAADVDSPVIDNYKIVISPADVMVPLAGILPVDDMPHCDVHTPTPVCAPTENPPLFLINHSV